MKKFPYTKGTIVLASAVLALTLAGCGQDESTDTTAATTPPTPTTPASTPAETPATAATPAAAPPATAISLPALPGLESQAPTLTEKTTVRMQTSAGDLVIEVYPQAAPNAAERFVTLVESGYYDNTPIFRIVPGFVAQFGINGAEQHIAWREMPFDDDPSMFALERGTLAFAKAGPNTNSTQVFINYGDNNRLAAPAQNFTTFGKIVSGLEIIDSFVAVGDPSMGLDQDRLWQDAETYLAEQPVKPTMIIDAEVVK